MSRRSINTEAGFGFRVARAMVLCLFAAAFLCRCAAPLAPQGGPKDTVAPRVVAVRPGWGMTNFTDKRITIEFDEYVVLGDQQREFFVSPMMKSKPSLSIRGKTVQIDIRDTLAENTTYSLNFGRSVRDNNEGNILYNLRYVFSTGPEVDSMIMSGYVVDAVTTDTAKSAFVYLYDAGRWPLGESDSLLIKGESPDALIRVNGNGNFIAENLKPVYYRAYAFSDENDNMTYDPGSEKVGFIDSLVNPLTMPDSRLWFDTVRQYFVADPQTYIRLFEQKVEGMQRLSGSSRPESNRIELSFSSPNPLIESIELDGIEPERIITEYMTENRDTVTLWINRTSRELPDTLRALLTYMKHDSLRVLQSATDTLRLAWTDPEQDTARNDRRNRNRREADEAAGEAEAGEESGEAAGIADTVAVVQHFRLRADIPQSFIPLDSILLTLEQPSLDYSTDNISVFRLAEEGRRFRVNATVERNAAKLREWIITAPWVGGEEYQLSIAEGAFIDISGRPNDSLATNFKVIKTDETASVMLNIVGQTPESRYIVEVADTSNRVIRRYADVSTSGLKIDYIPVGKVRIFITDDVNGNGRRDGGDLIMRRQPERVEVMPADTEDNSVEVRANWEYNFDLDMSRIFAPLHIETVRRQFDSREESYRQKSIMDAIERRASEAQAAGASRSQGSSGLPGGMSGILGGGR